MSVHLFLFTQRNNSSRKRWLEYYFWYRAEAKPVCASFSSKSYGDRTKFVATVRESLYTAE